LIVAIDQIAAVKRTDEICDQRDVRRASFTPAFVGYPNLMPDADWEELATRVLSDAVADVAGSRLVSIASITPLARSR
jgi:hypothetical protein